MSESANVQSIQVLDELRTAVAYFRVDAEEILQAAAQEIHRTLKWLDERKRFWLSEVRNCDEAVKVAQRTLARCEASGTTDKETGRTIPPNCSDEQRRLLQARLKLRESEDQLRTVQSWINLIQTASDEYQTKARQMGTWLSSDSAKAAAHLSRSADKLRAYATVAIGLPEIGMANTTTLGDDNTDSHPNIQVTTLTHEHRGLTWFIKAVPHADGSRVDVYIGKDSDAYPHVHAFYPDKSGGDEFAVLSWSRKSHSNLGELPTGLSLYILDLLANLSEESSTAHSYESQGPITSPESHEGSLGGPERRG